MNCEKCHELISDLLDGSLSRADEATLNSHLQGCLGCAEVRNDLQSILGVCRARRGEYTAPPNEKALWLRIRNIIEAEAPAMAGGPAVAASSAKQRWSNWLSRSWQVSLPQLAATVAAIVLVVSLATAVGMRRWQGGVTAVPANNLNVANSDVRSRTLQQQQMISYWNQRVAVNKARWNPQMRETFDRNLQVIDQAVSDSLNELSRSPHDEVSEEMLNAALSEKLALLKEFAEL